MTRPNSILFFFFFLSEWSTTQKARGAVPAVKMTGMRRNQRLRSRTQRITKRSSSPRMPSVSTRGYCAFEWWLVQSCRHWTVSVELNSVTEFCNRGFTCDWESLEDLNIPCLSRISELLEGCTCTRVQWCLIEVWPRNQSYIRNTEPSSPD